MKYTQNIREEELKNQISKDFFPEYDCAKIIGNVDFCVSTPEFYDDEIPQHSLLWAEAKRGKSDIYKSFVQLILTIGKARTFDEYLPPSMLAAFDTEKIAFIPYNDIHEVFYLNDFNWNVTPSNHSSKEFELIYNKAKNILDQNTLIFYYTKDEAELKKFIAENFVAGKYGLTKTRIDKNNFLVIYTKWLQSVKPTIAVNWGIANRNGIIAGDFYLADLLAYENETLKEKLYVLLRKNKYVLDRKIDEQGMFSSKTASFTDNQKAHIQFWNKYQRPPEEEYWNYIVERRDLLVPQDIRERRGSFFTPQIWVELSQKYLAETFGKHWQDEFYIWDCAAGTGNLLAGLTNKYHIWASTIDTQDVDVMKDRIKNGANMLEKHVFQFDFLNDDFSKLPQSLQKIINDPEKQKKLIIYINPPYAEHGNRTTILDKGKHKSKVATQSKVYQEFSKVVGTGVRELFAQFFLRVNIEIPNCTLASFSTVKLINSQNFSKFRENFKAKFEKGFICNAKTFDNVKGNFPIGFFIWNLHQKDEIKALNTDVFEIQKNKAEKTDKKKFYVFESDKYISTWLRGFYDKKGEGIGYIILPGVDMQQQNGVYFTSQPTESDIKQHKTASITKNNLLEMSVYLSVRQSIKMDWTNNKDQFLYPKKGWKTDTEFQNDCLAFALFHGQNKISAEAGTNHWIPFSETEVDATEKFDSNLMSKFINGTLKIEQKADLYNGKKEFTTPKLEFSPEAKAVFDAGKNLWKYYHKQENCNVNASLYDIKAHFQGRTKTGRMKSKSDDKIYTDLLNTLNEKLKILSIKIKPKVYEYEFLKK